MTDYAISGVTTPNRVQIGQYIGIVNEIKGTMIARVTDVRHIPAICDCCEDQYTIKIDDPTPGDLKLVSETYRENDRIKVYSPR